jgi:hypothetical protein
VNRYADLWLLFRRENGCVEIADLGQRSPDDYTPDLGLLNTVIGLKGLRHRREEKIST